MIRNRTINIVARPYRSENSHALIEPYYIRVSRRLTRADVVQVLLADPVLWAVVAGYLAAALAVIGWGNHPAVAPLLHGSLP